LAVLALLAVLASGVWLAGPSIKKTLEGVGAGSMTENQTALEASALLAGHSKFIPEDQKSDLNALLKEGSYTVFLPSSPISDIKSHIVASRYESDRLKHGQLLITLRGRTLAVNVKEGKLLIGADTISEADIKVGDDVIHLLD